MDGRAGPDLHPQPSAGRGQHGEGLPGSGAQSAAGAGSAEKGWDEAQPPCRAEATHREPEPWPRACGHICPPRANSAAFTPGERSGATREAGRGVALRQGGNRSAQTEGRIQKAPPDCFRKDGKYGRGRTGPRGQGRGRGVLAAAPHPSSPKLRAGLGVPDASPAWILQPGEPVWTLALLSDRPTRGLSFPHCETGIMLATTPRGCGDGS